MDPKIFWELNEAYQSGVYQQEETLTEEEILSIEEWVEDLIAEGYDLDDYTDEEIYEAYLNEGLGTTIRRLFGGKKKNTETPEPQGRIAELRRKHGVTSRTGPESPRGRILSRMQNRINADERKHGENSSAVQQSTADRNRMLRGGYSQYNMNDRRGRGNAARRREESLRNEEFDVYDVISDYLVEQGFCDTYEDANVIMANMSEDWRNEILEVYRPLPVEKMQGKYKKLIHKGAEAEVLARQLGQIPRGFRTITGTKGLPERLRNKKEEFAVRAAKISSTMATHDPEKWKNRDSMVAQKRHLQAQLNVLTNPRSNIRSQSNDPNKPHSNIRTFKRTQNEEFDVYDVISNYLVEQGFCDTYEDANVIMANMSEDWRNEILEATVMSVTSPSGEKRTLNIAKARPAVKLRGAKRQAAFRDIRQQNVDRRAPEITRELNRKFDLGLNVARPIKPGRRKNRPSDIAYDND